MNRKLCVFGTLAIFALALLGCGGGGTGTPTGGGTGGGGGGGRSYPTFNLGSGGSVQTVFLSGQDRVVPRRGAGSNQIAVIRDVRYSNTDFDFIPTANQQTGGEVRVKLDAYTINYRTFGVSFGPGEASKGFTEYPMEIAQILEQQLDGSVLPLTPNDQIAFTPLVPFDAAVRVFPGRVTSVSVRLDDSMLVFSTVTNSVEFNSDRFIAANYSPVTNSIASSFADYVSFDLSGLATSDRPEMTTDGTPADRVFYSGDGIGMSRGMGPTSLFELLDPVNIQSGKVSTGPILGGGGNQVQGSNLILLEDEDPSATRLVSLVATWRPFASVVFSSDPVVAIAFPSSRESESINPGEGQQMVIYRVGGTGRINAMWQGQVFYDSATNPTAGTFRLYPINTIDDAIPEDPVEGTVSNLVVSSGVVRRGDWTVTSSQPNWPFGTSGGYGVYRR